MTNLYQVYSIKMAGCRCSFKAGNLKNIFLVIGITLLLTSQTVEAFDARFHFWIHAFIPKENLLGPPNYFLKTEKDTYVLSVPFNNTIMERFDMTGLIGTCFMTDNRLFSDDPMASARVTVELIAVIEGRNMRIEKAENRPMRRIGETHNVDCITGEEKQSPKRASINSITIGDIQENGSVKSIVIRAASPNPFFTLLNVNGVEVGVAPDIDFTVKLAYRHSNRRMYIKIDYGTFPSFEAYYKLNNQPVERIIKLPPAEGATASDLFDFGGLRNTRHYDSSVKLQ